MKTVTLTCVSCGNTSTVPNSPDQVRNRTCANCKAALIQQRAPGSVL